VILLTDRHQAARPLPDVVAAAVTGGVRLVVVREKDLPPVERMRLADRLRGLLASVGGRVLLAGPVPGPHGCHLSAADPWPLLRRGLVGRSCHRMQELTRAAAGGADYATLSPILPTKSKPGYGPALGLDALAETSPAPLPVYALGGITTPAQAGRCAEAGAAGVAVMGALMRAADPVALAAGLVTAVISSRSGDQYLRRPVPGVCRPGEVN
jgi:thiamine monophosphate synthase